MGRIVAAVGQIPGLKLALRVVLFLWIAVGSAHGMRVHGLAVRPDRPDLGRQAPAVAEQCLTLDGQLQCVGQPCLLWTVAQGEDRGNEAIDALPFCGADPFSTTSQGVAHGAVLLWFSWAQALGTPARQSRIV